MVRDKLIIGTGYPVLGIFVKLCIYTGLILFLIETPFNFFANRADPDQAALVRAA